jgi:hypothetical protein
VDPFSTSFAKVSNPPLRRYDVEVVEALSDKCRTLRVVDIGQYEEDKSPYLKQVWRLDTLLFKTSLD